MPILAKRTAEVATGKPDGKNLRAGKKMVQGFFLYGVHSKGGNMTVKRQEAYAVFIAPYAAGAKMTARYFATAGAERTAYNAACFFL
jgi:hypothetical protein